jgi:5-methylcytosine-specific restriction endonuclease McrA
MAANEKRQRIFDAQGGKCCYCERPMLITGTMSHTEFRRLHGLKTRAEAAGMVATFEHLKRRVDGGTRHNWNIALACARCNSQRGERTWVEFRTLMRPGESNASKAFVRAAA